MSEAMVSAVDETAFADLVSKIQDAEYYSRWFHGE